jgi:outer membrane protein TolC
MSELREALTEALNTCPGLSRQHGEKCADAVLRMLTEHGDTQQVREQLSAAIASAWYSTAGDPTVLDEVMTVVAPILAARDAAVERAEDAERDLAEMQGHYAMARERTVRAEADLAAARQQLDQVRAEHSRSDLVVSPVELPGIYERTRRIVWRDAPARPAGHDETGQ